MSWAEDNLIDIYDEELDSSFEENWNDGIHIDRNGSEYKISKMTTKHLENTIKYFSGLDTSKLEEELKRRLT